MQEFTRKALTVAENMRLEQLVQTMAAAEGAQVLDLVNNCNNKYQFAKTHSVYLKDWEKTKGLLEAKLKNGDLPAGVSATFHAAVIEVGDELIQNKLKAVQGAFQRKFGESIFNYLGSDGKTRGILGGLFS